MSSSTLDCAPGEPQRAYVQANGIQLSYLEWGQSGPPLVLLHGITSSARTWWRVAPALQQRGFHVYAFDMPGHGESAETNDHRIEAIAATVAAALRALNLSDVTLIGHSWGGITALTLAHSADDALLKRTALIDPPLKMDPERGAERLPGFLEGVGEPPEQTLPRVRANNPDWHECDFHWKGEALVQCRADAVRGLFLHSGNWDSTGYFAEIEMPLLLLVPDPEHSAIPADVLEIARGAMRSNTHLQYIPNTTHNMFRGKGFEPTLAALLAWLGV